MIASEENKTVGSSGGSVKLFYFDGKKDEWNMWNKKTFLLCSRFKYAEALEEDLAEKISKTEDDKDKEKLRTLNRKAYEHLALSVKGTAFGMVTNSTSTYLNSTSTVDAMFNVVE